MAPGLLLEVGPPGTPRPQRQTDPGGSRGDSDPVSCAVAADVKWATGLGRIPNKTTENLLSLCT